MLIISTANWKWENTIRTGANPTTFEFTAATPALVVG
jgi:hypothetical protein